MAPRSMDVAVIGAGIGGLSAAIALRRQGEAETETETAVF